MNKRNKHLIVGLCLAILILLVCVEVSQAARWSYHAWRRGRVTVWGTRNCRRVTRPLVYRRYMYQCQRIRGYLPWYCNDWLVRHEWGWPCYNITYRKYVARPCPRSCWRKRWFMGSLDTYFGDYIPYAYPSLSEVVIPTVGDPNGHLTGNQELFVFTDIGDWLEGTAGAGLPYVPLPDGADPNTRSYEFTDGNSPDLPGFIVMHTEPGMPVEDLIVFNPDADPNDYPFEVTRPDLLFSGRLYLQSDDTFTSEEYNGYLMHADADRSGTVDFNDFALMADMWTEDVGTAGPIPETP